MEPSLDGLGEVMFNMSPSIILICDEYAIIRYANPQACTKLIQQDDNLVGKSLSSFILSDESNYSPPPDFLSWLTAKAEQEYRFSIHASDQKVFRSKIVVSPAKNSSDGATKYVIYIHDSGELDQTTEELDRYKYLLETALGAIPDGFAVYDENDRLQIFNKAYADVYARSKPAIRLGERFEDILRYGLKNGQYLEAGKTAQEHEDWLKRRLELHFNPTGPSVQNVGDRWLRVEERRLEDGRIVGIRADITQLIEAKSDAEMLGNVLENMAAPVVFMDLKTKKFDYANKAMLDKIGYTLDEFTRLGPLDINVGLSKEASVDFFNQAVENPGAIISLRTRHRRKDGTTYPCVVNTVSDEGQDKNRLIAFIHDETEEEKIRQELEIERAQLQTLIHALPCFITQAKPDSTLVFANDDYAAFYGLKPEDIIGKKFLEVVPGVDKKAILADINALTEDNPVYSSEREGVDRFGNKYTLFWTSRMLYRDGKPHALLSAGRDVTKAKEAEAKIEKQAHELGLRNRALEQFAGIVSHDLKSPLRHIRMFGEMFLEDFENGETERHAIYIEKMRENIERMERMIAALLEFSQMAYKQVNRTKFMLSTAVQEANDNLLDVITAKKAKVHLDKDIELNADYILCTRLFQNLIGNSIKYNEDGNCPRVHINCEIEGGIANISVQDNGIGIPPNQSERIFNVFQRLHIDEKQYAGTGIGLALVKRIVEGHNGHIALDTEFSDGAKFDISLPV